jgi:hypothetical protein
MNEFQSILSIICYVFVIVFFGLGLIAFYFIFFKTKPKRKSCITCGGDLVDHPDGQQCPACKLIY